MLDVDAVCDRIRAILETPTANYVPLDVFEGEPGVLPPHNTTQAHRPFACFWLTEETSKSKTFGNVMVTTAVRVGLYFLAAREAEPRVSVERVGWKCLREVQESFRADSKLDAAGAAGVTDMEIGLARWEYVQFNVGEAQTLAGPTYRRLQFDLLIDDLEAEAISG